MKDSIYIRKIAASLFAVAVFATSASFSPAGTVKTESDNKVILQGNDGEEIEAEELSASDNETFAADESDVEDIVAQSKIAAAEFEAKNDSETGNGDTEIYDESTGYKNAAFGNDWSLILINKEHHIPDNYSVELGTIKGSIKSDVRVTEHILDLLKGAKNDGITIYICSPYRDSKKQQLLFERKKKSYLRKGYSEQEAYKLASETVAIPGTSEHEVGLAFDLISDEYQNLDAGFADTEAGRWLAANACNYGFILRYPKGKEDITEIEFEPWHYRYVGTEAAKEMKSDGLCLEEYDKMIGLVE